ncbi:MAG: methionine--tRNA ligase [Kiritimatiellae bacterium]|nr:methionine--tRNA ligase [Kiritimatiellia bacterium]MDD5522200.1 methionine--tRNA ligase [Kiritimatiellia bacterium]
MQRSKFYVTTPIYYVNDKPHIGHAYTTILADVLARYHRLMGVPSFFLTGTDEHGQKVCRAAEKSGMSPQEQADSTVVRFLDVWKKLEITNDDFIRTTENRHRIVVQKVLQDLHDRDEIYRADYDGWYCVTCERFFTEKDLINGKCPEPGCGRDVEKIKESNYFFRMSKYQDWLIKYIEDNPRFIQPDFRRNETLGFLKKQLNDLCISRPKSRMSWGIELPFDKGFVTYVWFDALLNYVTSIGYLSDDARFKKWWPASCQLIGKDILTTHTVYWPTMLKAMNLPLPETVFAHGWWLSGRDKMSKTAGNVVNPMDFVDKYGVDAFRYFLMAEMSLGQDASFTEDAFLRRYNADLANDLGNLLSRVVKLIGSYCDGNIPPPGTMGSDEENLKKVTLIAVEKMIDAVDGMRIDLGLAEVIGVVRETNRYLEKTQPWTLGKKGEKAQLGTVLFCAVEALRIMSGLLYPVMPTQTIILRKTLGLSSSVPDFRDLKEWGKTKTGTKIGAMINLFPRITPVTKDVVMKKGVNMTETTTAEKSPGVTEQKQPVTVPAGVVQIEYMDFAKVQLRTAVVLSAEKVEGADKLLRLQIRVGDENRQIVAGIALHYKPEELPGKNIVVVTNLKPAKIRGVESNGMLLAASNEGVMKLITIDGELPAGSVVK